MNENELAEKMLLWGNNQILQNNLAEEIAQEVLKMGKTFKVGSISASYGNPRKTYLYEEAVMVSDAEYVLEDYEKPTVYDWKKLAEDLKLKADFTVAGKAKVTVKMTK